VRANAARASTHVLRSSALAAYVGTTSAAQSSFEAGEVAVLGAAMNAEHLVGALIEGLAWPQCDGWSTSDLHHDGSLAIIESSLPGTSVRSAGGVADVP